MAAEKAFPGPRAMELRKHPKIPSSQGSLPGVVALGKKYTTSVPLPEFWPVLGDYRSWKG